MGCKGAGKEEGTSPQPPYLHVFPASVSLQPLLEGQIHRGCAAVPASTSTGPSDARAGAQRLKRGPAPVLFLAPAMTHCVTLGKSL